MVICLAVVVVDAHDGLGFGGGGGARVVVVMVVGGVSLIVGSEGVSRVGNDGVDVVVGAESGCEGAVGVTVSAVVVGVTSGVAKVTLVVAGSAVHE